MTTSRRSALTMDGPALCSSWVHFDSPAAPLAHHDPFIAMPTAKDGPGQEAILVGLPCRQKVTTKAALSCVSSLEGRGYYSGA
jgi:hypothetical protein